MSDGLAARNMQIARLCPGKPVPCPVAGLAGALEGYDSLGHAAIEQAVFGRFCGQLAIADSRRLMEAGAKLARFQNAARSSATIPDSRAANDWPPRLYLQCKI